MKKLFLTGSLDLHTTPSLLNRINMHASLWILEELGVIDCPMLAFDLCWYDLHISCVHSTPFLDILTKRFIIAVLVSLQGLKRTIPVVATSRHELSSSGSRVVTIIQQARRTNIEHILQVK